MARPITRFNAHFFQKNKKVLYREAPGQPYLASAAEMEDRLARDRKKLNIPKPEVSFLREAEVNELDEEETVHKLNEADIEEVHLPDVRDMKDRFALDRKKKVEQLDEKDIEEIHLPEVRDMKDRLSLDRKTFLDPKQAEPIYDSTGTLFGMGKKEQAYREQDAREILGKTAYEALQKEGETKLQQERKQRIDEARNALLEVVDKIPETRPAQGSTGISTEIPNPVQARRPKGISGLFSRVTQLFKRG
ncbi:MAG: hypothetical protein KBD15_03240 [Candidatus Magasanikbacteria bacterium]|jgi:hypothetical protein|nr:hypothetical protein [Candidatus Magasanikbacteria bacterium]